MLDRNFSVHRVTVSDDLPALVAEINAPEWDESNELPTFTAERLDAFLRRPDCVFLVCREHRSDSVSIVGLASAQSIMKPHCGRPSLYVDEIDVRPTHRRQGIGRRLLRHLMGMASDQACRELWLATEQDNVAARGLYDSLGPSECTVACVYSFDSRAMEHNAQEEVSRP